MIYFGLYRQPLNNWGFTVQWTKSSARRTKLMQHKRNKCSELHLLELDKENKELKEHKVKTSIALTVLDRLKQEHLEIYREVISQKKKPTTSEKKNWWSK